MTKSGYIYGLYDSRNLPVRGSIRYVGKSVNPIHRLQCHRSCARNPERYPDRSFTHQYFWMRLVESEGATVEMVILEECLPEEMDIQETAWIRSFRNFGCDLTNKSNGGTGGAVTDENSLRSMSEKMKLRWQDPEYRDRVTASHVGWSPTEETRKLISDNSKVMWDTPGYRESHAEIMEAVRASEEFEQKRVAGLKRAWADPSMRAKRKATVLKRYEDPEYFANLTPQHRGNIRREAH